MECSESRECVIPAKDTHNPQIFVKCRYCNKDFTKDYSRKRHELKIHGINTNTDNEVAVKSGGGFKCSVCYKVFSTSSNMRAHERRFHGVNPSPIAYVDGPTVVKCKDCNVTFSNLNNYRKHLLEVHEIKSHKIHHTFSSEEEFLDWKGSLEMDTGVNYTAHSGPRTTSGGIKQIFYCRRSGVQSTKVSSQRRAGKSQGTCKMGSYCTSSIEVVKKDGKLSVTLYSDHRDHDLSSNSLVHMTLPKSEQDKIADMIAQGIEPNKILEQVREASEGKRTSFLEKKDIDNIRVTYGLNQTTTSQIENYQEQIKDKIMSQILPKCSEIQDFKLLKTANNMLSELIATLDGGRKHTTSTSNLSVDTSTISEQANKKCVKQDQLFPQEKETKKVKMEA